MCRASQAHGSLIEDTETKNTLIKTFLPNRDDLIQIRKDNYEDRNM